MFKEVLAIAAADVAAIQKARQAGHSIYDADFVEKSETPPIACTEPTRDGLTVNDGFIVWPKGRKNRQRVRAHLKTVRSQVNATLTTNDLDPYTALRCHTTQTAIRHIRLYGTLAIYSSSEQKPDRLLDAHDIYAIALKLSAKLGIAQESRHLFAGEAAVAAIEQIAPTAQHEMIDDTTLLEAATLTLTEHVD